MESESQLNRMFSPSYTLGLLFIVAVAVIWAASSVLIQHIYQDLDFKSPFLLTYLSTSLFIVYLPLWQLWIQCGIVRKDSTTGSEISSLSNSEAGDIVNELHDDVFSDNMSIDENVLEDVDIHTQTDRNSSTQGKRIYTHTDIIKIAAVVCPLWFIANCLYNYSLFMTSVSSSTIISNLSGSFTLAFAWYAGIENITKGKIAGIIVAFLGAVCVALSDSEGGGDADDDSVAEHTFFGDIVALLAAMGYGAYTSVIRYSIPDDECVSMQLLLGYVGLLNAVILAPILIILYFLHLDNMAHLTGVVVGFMVINGMCNNVLSDYLWARAVVLTSPTVATVGISITIPLAMVSDLLVHGIQPTYLSLLGALLVILGFGFVNITTKHEKQIWQYWTGKEESVGYEKVALEPPYGD